MDNIPLPYGGMTEDQIQKLLSQPGQGGPDATTGYNPNSPTAQANAAQIDSMPVSTPDDDSDEDSSPLDEKPSGNPAQSPYDRILSYLKPKAIPKLNLDIGQSKYTPDTLNDALKTSQMADLTSQLGKAGELIGTGITGTTGLKPTQAVGTEAFNNIAKSGEKGVQNYQIMKDNEKDDPNSPMSQMFRQYAKQFGVNVKGDFTASQGEKLLPYVFKGFEANEARNAKHEDTAIKLLELQDNKDSKRQAKLDDTATKRFDDLNKKLTSEIASSRSAFGRGANTVRSAEAIERLAGGTDPNNLDTRQITEIARNLDSMLSNGSPSISGMNKLIPNTAMGSAAKIEEWLLSKPRGAQQGEFVKRMLDTVTREKNLAREQLQRTQGSILGSYTDLQKNYPDKFKDVLASHDIPDDITNFSNRANKALQKTISSSTLKDYAMKHAISEDDAKNLLTKAGYVIQ